MTIMKKSFFAMSFIIAGMALAPVASFAQVPVETTNSATGGDLPTNIPGHPRVDEVNQRDDNQQNRIDKGEADGKLSTGQAAKDQAKLDKQEAIQQKQEAANGGHLTKGEQMKDNKSLNKSSKKIYKQKRGMGRRYKKK